MKLTNVVAYSDYKNSMSMLHLTGVTQPCPAWANDLEKLRKVLAGRLAKMANYFGPLPTDLAGLRELEKRATAQFSKAAQGSEPIRTALAVAQRKGGFLALYTAIAWRRFRLGQHSTTIAADLGVSPNVVRRQAASLALVAREMYPNEPGLHLPPAHNSKVTVRPFEQRPRGHAMQRGKQQQSKKELRSDLDNKEVVRLRLTGLTYSEIGKRLGAPRETVRVRFIKAVTHDGNLGANINGKPYQAHV